MKKLIPSSSPPPSPLSPVHLPRTQRPPSRKLDPGTDRSNYPCPNHSPFYPVANSYNNGDTYYAFVPRGKDSLLLKTDYAAATQTVNCAVPGCAHDSDACPAYFTDDPGRNLVITDDPLRVCHVEDRDCPVQIYTVDPAAGKAMQEINGVGNCDIAYCDGTALYGIDKTVLPSEATPACRIDLASGQLDRFTMLPSELMLGCYDDGLLTVHYVTDAPLPKTAQSMPPPSRARRLNLTAGTRAQAHAPSWPSASTTPQTRGSAAMMAQQTASFTLWIISAGDGTDIKLSLTVVDQPWAQRKNVGYVAG